MAKFWYESCQLHGVMSSCSLTLPSGCPIVQDAHDIFGDVSGLLEQYEASKAARGAEQGDEEGDVEADEAEPEFEDDTAAEQWQLNKVHLKTERRLVFDR